ncbi:MAG: DUF4248 domain-containing protein [Parabacteroides sp.]|mgnify:FL=1|jgi:hypothetical protein|uniref:DUF4248 domain-containing protein n=1 Tax=Bacteroidales TaxID=171549 RepID=UPI002A128880|nr:DUF4248 domain-containing protein [Parabacteroides sp.]NCB26369.1 DUF4248 domain-containing protein [Bacteroidia bacterium]
MEKQPIKSYGWSQLAQLYSPELTPAGASRQLRSWVAKHPTLLSLLHQDGWQKGGRRLTPRQVSILFDCLGCP